MKIHLKVFAFIVSISHNIHIIINQGSIVRAIMYLSVCQKLSSVTVF